jgi:hypothetical protein
MSEAYAGKQVVGIDVHRRRPVIVRMTESGQRLETVVSSYFCNQRSRSRHGMLMSLPLVKACVSTSELNNYPMLHVNSI